MWRASQRPFLSRRDREFESCSLQERVRCELGPQTTAASSGNAVGKRSPRRYHRASITTISESPALRSTDKSSQVRCLFPGTQGKPYRHPCRLIDWPDACRGDPSADVCRSYLLLKLHAEEIAEPYLDAYCRIADLSRATIVGW